MLAQSGSKRLHMSLAFHAIHAIQVVGAVAGPTLG